MYNFAKITRSDCPILLFKAGNSLNTFLLMDRDLYLKTCLAARVVRVDMRRTADVGGSGGQPGSNARVGRSLDDD
jgi:hypothetical protein